MCVCEREREIVRVREERERSVTFQILLYPSSFDILLVVRWQSRCFESFFQRKMRNNPSKL